MAGNPVTKDEIIRRFIDLVKTPTTKTVTWHSGGLFPVTGTSHNLLGSSTQANPTTNDLPQGDPLTTRVFHILHGFALQMTRFRRVTYRVTSNDSSSNVGSTTQWAALNNLIWFDIPAVPAPGIVVDSGQLDTFLRALKAEIDRIQASGSYQINIHAYQYVCHSSCHSSCHGSRGRR